MTPEQTKANFLVDNLGKSEAISHVDFVLSYIEKTDLRIFWVKVWGIIKEF